MQVLQPATLGDALDVRRDVPHAVVVAGGTDVMPARNRGERPGPLLDLSRVRELRQADESDGVVRFGAATTYTQAIEAFDAQLPVLAAAARTVASRQVRNRATLGGALALADPSADVLAALLAAGAQVEVGAAGAASRMLPLGEFLTGPWTTALGDGELVTAVRVPRAAGPSAYAKVGARNAMARAICAVAVTLDLEHRRAAVAVAAAAPTPVRATEAEALLDGLPDSTLDSATLHAFGAAVARATTPRDDRRGSAAYKRHAAAVLARRALARAWAGRSEAPWA